MWDKGYEYLLGLIRRRAEDATALHGNRATNGEQPLIDALDDIIRLCKDPSPKPRAKGK